MARAFTPQDQEAIDQAAEIFNADAARVARGYRPGERWYFRINDSVYGFPKELTRKAASALRTLADDDLDGLLSILLGDQMHAFEEEFVTLPDILTILDAYEKTCGQGLPDRK